MPLNASTGDEIKPCQSPGLLPLYFLMCGFLFLLRTFDMLDGISVMYRPKYTFKKDISTVFSAEMCIPIAHSPFLSISAFTNDMQ